MIYGIGGLLGLYFGGELASRYAAKNERLQLKTIAILYSGVAVFSALVYLSPNHYLAFGWMALAGAGGAAANGPLFATIRIACSPNLPYRKCLTLWESAILPWDSW
jgi:MFS family permease